MKLFKLNFNQKFFVIYIIVVLIITSLSISMYYVKVKADTTEERINLYRKIHEKTSLTCENLGRKVTSIYNDLLIVNQNIIEYFQNSNSEKIDYYNLTLVQKHLTNIINANEEISSIYLYSSGNNRVFSTNFMFSDLSGFPQRELFNTFLNQDKKKKWFESRFERIELEDPVSILSFVAYSPFNVNHGAIAININEARLLDSLSHPETGIILLDIDNNILSFTNRDIHSFFLRNKDKITDMFQENKSVYRYASQNKEYYFYISKLNDVNLSVVTFVSSANITPAINNNYLYLVVLLCVIVAIVMFVFLRKTFTKPILEYSKGVKENLGDLRESLITGILTGKHEAEEMLLKSEKLGIKMNSYYFLVVVFQIDNYYKYLMSTENTSGLLNNRIFFNAVRWMFELEKKAYVVKTEFDKITVLLPFEEYKDFDVVLNDIKGTITYLQNEIRENSGLTVSVGISNLIEGLPNAHKCYSQALESLNYKSVYRKESIICYGYLKRNDNIFLRYPIEDLNKIADCIKEKDYSGVEQLLDEIIEKISLEQNLRVDFVNVIFSNILYNIVKLVLDSQYKLSDIFAEDIFITLYNCEFLQDKKEFVLNVLNRLITYMQTKESNVNNNIIQNAINYININFEKSISLSMLADILHVNASYLSVLFKKELGFGFVDYINDLRLKKSVELLKENNITIKEVAEVCGYENIHTYLRNFKKAYLVTPSEFRNKHLEAKVKGTRGQV